MMKSIEEIKETLKESIIDNAKIEGWKVKKINDKQIEIIKNRKDDDNYERLCYELIVKSLSK